MSPASVSRSEVAMSGWSFGNDGMARLLVPSDGITDPATGTHGSDLETCEATQQQSGLKMSVFLDQLRSSALRHALQSPHQQNPLLFQSQCYVDNLNWADFRLVASTPTRGRIRTAHFINDLVLNNHVAWQLGHPGSIWPQ